MHIYGILDLFFSLGHMGPSGTQSQMNHSQIPPQMGGLGSGGMGSGTSNMMMNMNQGFAANPPPVFQPMSTNDDDDDDYDA